jgi:hypothetical protein
MKNTTRAISMLTILGLCVSGPAFSADTAKKQAERATKQSGEVTFDGARGSTTTAGGSSAVTKSTSTATSPRTQEQAIKEYKDSSKTTDAQMKAIENYKNSGKSRSGQ